MENFIRNVSTQHNALVGGGGMWGGMGEGEGGGVEMGAGFWNMMMGGG